MGKRKFSFIELFIAIVVLSILVAVLLPVLARSHSGRRMNCPSFLKQMGTIMRMYSGENDERFPRMHGDQAWASNRVAEDCGCVDINGSTEYQDHAVFMLDLRAVYPEYLQDRKVLICPGDPDVKGVEDPVAQLFGDTCPWKGEISQGDESYVYLGWVLDKLGPGDPMVDSSVLGLPGGQPIPAQFAALFLVITGVVDDRNIANDGPLDQDVNLAGIAGAVGLDLDALGNGGTGSYVRRLSEGTWRYLVTNRTDRLAIATAEKNLPILWDNFPRTPGYDYNHASPAGHNVLFMDGHVEFRACPGEFPACDSFKALRDFFDGIAPEKP